jgi:hypothetical protein
VFEIQKKLNKGAIWHHECNTMDQSNESNESNANESVATTITNQVPGYYKCGHCALHFKTRARFRSHEATCLSLKQIRARATFAPATVSESATTMADLFALVQQLAVRLETAEHELGILKQQQKHLEQHKNPNKIHRDNLLEWLNGEARLEALIKAWNNQTFSDWLLAIPPLTRDHLALVFQHGFMDGMCAIIAAISPPDSSPLCAYDEAPGVLFVYEQQHPECMGAPEKNATKTLAWRPMSRPEFERFINRMQKLLMNEFVGWQQEHQERWHDPDFAEQYDANLMKVMGSGKAKGGGCSNRDMLMTRMKPKVHAAIKRAANTNTII